MQRRTSNQTTRNHVPKKGLGNFQGRVQLAANPSSGPIRSRPVGSDSNTDSDGLNEFASNLDMAVDIVEERQHRETNEGKAKPKKFQPKRRKIEEDDGDEPLDEEALKARQWRPSKKLPPEHMTASVAAQQMKYNPLIKLLNIKITIIRPNDYEDFNYPAQSDNHPHIASIDSRSPSGADGKVVPSIRERNSQDIHGDSVARAKKAALSPKDQMFESRDVSPAPTSELSTTESDGPSNIYDELPTTADEDEPPKELEFERNASSQAKSEDEPPQESPVEVPENHKLAKTKKHSFSKSTTHQPDPTSCLSSTASEENGPSKFARNIKADEHCSRNPPSELSTTDTDVERSEQPNPSSVPKQHSTGALTLPKKEMHTVTYPRIQLESRPNLEISSEAQDVTGPLVLSKTIKLTESINKFLKPYQRDGVKFFFQHFEQKNGVILGDDMGLGKTIQVIAFLSAIMGLQGKPDEKNRRKNAINNLPIDCSYKPSELGPTCLVICPNSVIDNWAREIKTWGYFEYSTLSGNTGAAETAARFNAGAFDILICGITYARDHIEELCDLDFTVVVVDEVQYLKNSRSGVSQAFHKFKTKIRFGLTGTAMQNELSELHTLFDWVRPGALGTPLMWEVFVSIPLLRARKSDASVYEIQLGSERAQALVRNCWPDLQLRRTKSKILHELPPRTDQIALCPMTEIQKLAHDNLLSDPDVVNMRNHDMPCPCKRVDDKGKRYVLGMCCDQGWSRRIFPYLILLQKVSNHLALTCPNKQDTTERYKQDMLYIQKMFPKGDSALERIFSKYDPELCGKWKVLKPLLDQWKKAQFKVLLFSQSTKMMDVLEYWLQQDFPEFVRLDGTVAVRQRFKRVEEFQTNPDKFIFLASIKAAAVGLNLTAANKVVIFDPSWNPSHDAQAMDRVVRIGQKREVECIRLISSGTAEELIYHRQVYKQGLFVVANTGKAPSRHFTGVQGDRKNQGDIFGVKNIFKKQASKHARLNPEEHLDDFSYVFDQFVARGAIAATESKDEFKLMPLEGLPQLAQPEPKSAEALLRHFGVDMLSHGEIVKPALDKAPHSALTQSRSQKPTNLRKKSRPVVVTQPPLRGVKQKANVGRKKSQSDDSSRNHSDLSSSDTSKNGIRSKDLGLLKSKIKRSP